MASAEGSGLAGLAVANALPALLGQAGIGLAAMDGFGRLSMLSPELVSMLGRPFESARAADLPRIYALYDEHGLHLLTGDELPLARARRGEKVVDAYMHVQVPDGPARHLRVNAVPVPATQGDFRGSLAMVEDVTLAREGTTTFSQMRQLLVQRVTHELRTPLTTIMGHTELLEEEADLPASARESVAAVRRAGDHLHAVAQRVEHLAAMPQTMNARRDMGGRDTDGPVKDVQVNARIVESRTGEEAGPTYAVNSYTVYPNDYASVADARRRSWCLRVEDAGDGWAVRWRSRCLNYRNVWEFEPPRKSRTHDFLRRCRFSERAALLRAQQAVDKLVVDGLTYEEFVDRVRDDAAAAARAALERGYSASPVDQDALAPVLPLHMRLKRVVGRRPPGTG